MATPYQFQCDYIAGCTPQIMDALLRHNLTEVPGYCEDMFCKEAEAKIREACKCPDAGVFFFAGGTICNLSLISAVLRPWQGVLAAPSGHIAAHETGAIEATGHKVLEIDAVDGKLTAEAVKKALVSYRTNAERIFYVEPGLVYISNPTELKTTHVSPTPSASAAPSAVRWAAKPWLSRIRSLRATSSRLSASAERFCPKVVLRD